MPDKSKNSNRNQKASFSRQERNKQISKLGSFNADYNLSNFLADLETYFEGEVDFNLDRIKAEVGQKGKLSCLVSKARQNNTHPVVEFIQEIFKDLG